MTIPLRVLILEDSPSDAELILAQLKSEGFDVASQRVDTRADFLAALSGPLDLILSDYSLPGFSGLDSIRLLKERGLEIPVILVSGAIGEDEAVIAIKEGAHDYLLKGKLARLGAAVRNTLEEKRLRDGERAAIQALRRAEEKYRSIFENAVMGIYQTTLEGGWLAANPALARTHGYASPEELMEQTVDLNRRIYVDPGRRAEFIRLVEEQGSVTDFESQVYRKDGRVIWVSEGARGIYNASGQLIGFEGTTVDITDRKKAEETQRQLAAAIEATPDFVGIADLDGRPLYLNKGAKEMLRIGEDEDFSKAKIAEVHPEWARELVLNEGIPTALRDGIWRGETALLTRDGREMPVLQVIVAPRRPDGTVGFHATIMRDITERKQAEEQARRRAEQMTAINILGRSLSETLDLDLIYERFYNAVVNLLPDSETVFISLFDHEQAVLRCAFAMSEGELINAAELPPIPLEPPGVGTQSEAVHTRRPVIINDLQARLKRVRVNVNVGDGSGRLPQSGLYVPMLAKERVIGVVQTQSLLLNRYTELDAELLSVVANTAAVAIQNARLFEKSNRQVDRLTALRAIDMTITASADLRLTLNVLLNQATARLGVDAANILLLNPVSQTLDYAAGRGFRTAALQQTHLRLGEGYAGQVALERHTVTISDWRTKQSEILNQESAIQNEGFIAYFGVPLIAKGQVKGVLEAFHRAPLNPDREWLGFLETLAEQAAIAIDNAQLFEGLQRSNVELALAYDATIEGWSRALDLRDKETEGHTQRVTEMTQRLSREMGMTEAEIVHIRRGALLHDMGKMGVPDSILLKPSLLTDEEWVIMRKHPTYAYEMLSPIAYLRPALDIPHCHHEKWDGTGYPRGLKGEQIPLAARIFAAVDVWDALTSDRSYRAAWSKEEALEYIREQAGRHFDPKVVEAFLSVIRGSDERI